MARTAAKFLPLSASSIVKRVNAYGNRRERWWCRHRNLVPQKIKRRVDVPLVAVDGRVRDRVHLAEHLSSSPTCCSVATNESNYDAVAARKRFNVPEELRRCCGDLAATPGPNGYLALQNAIWQRTRPLADLSMALANELIT